MMRALRVPTATYRLQFNADFTLRQALELVPYLRELGISDLYTSPLVKSCAGSTHGYDIVDFSQLDPKLGTEEELARLSQTLQSSEMGLLMDFVPNHMCISERGNRWWQDVLENGPSSIYSGYFNIAWNSPKVELKNKIVLAVLDRSYGEALERGDVRVAYEGGAFYVEYQSGRFPANPHSWSLILDPLIEEAASLWGEENPDLLELQSIATALANLPHICQKMEVRKQKERNREKEIIKRRLALLLESDSRMAQLLQSFLERLNGQGGNRPDWIRLEHVLEAQAYRLSFWKDNDINYRRFFDINDLATVRVEDRKVFFSVHELVLKYVGLGWITGLRLDHVDGLFDPELYFIELQEACARAIGGARTEEGRPFYCIAEKILVGEEKLNPRWSIFGTTGYDPLNLLNGLFVDGEGREKIEEGYARFIGERQEMAEVIYEGKEEILFSSMSSELRLLTRHLEEVSEQHRSSKGFTFDNLRAALREAAVCFPVYRAYTRVGDSHVGEEDRLSISAAIARARERRPDLEASLFQFIESVLLLQDPEGLTEAQRVHRRLFAMRFQQFTAPVMAKGMEDTAFYRHYPLVSLNEVGMAPSSFETTLSTFHEANLERLRLWPHTLVATSTHDSKRSEDVRARIHVLSEEPEAWEAALRRWHELNGPLKKPLEGQPVPGRNEEYLLYQTLVGTWPLYPMDAAGRAHYLERIEGYLIKAIREAKVHTSWWRVNEAYEQAVRAFIRQVLSLESDSPFVEELERFVSPVARAGLFNSLAQIVLKGTMPGVPDFYQGNELWEFQLVDPDNRHPVDYSTRSSLLRSLMERAREAPERLVDRLMQTPQDGRIKLYITARLLHFRRQHPLLFEKGEYLPLQVSGIKARHVVSFARLYEGEALIVASGRFYQKLGTAGDSTLPIGKVWEEAALDLPPSMAGEYRDLFTGVRVASTPELELPAGSLFSHLPFTLLERVKKA